MTRPNDVVPNQRSDSAIERAEESNIQPGLVRWIPLVPLLAVVILFAVYVIYAEVLS
jgi:hypothetical protein